MTAREKLAMEHPERVDSICLGGCAGCPDTYGYLPAPECCKGSIREGNHVKCTACWDREIPENTEKECAQIDYKAEYERLKQLNDELKTENTVLKASRVRMAERCQELRSTIDKYEAVIRCTEAFLGQKIIEK